MILIFKILYILQVGGNGSKCFCTLFHLQTHQQQTTFENIVTKVEIADDEQLLCLQQSFQIYSIISFSFIEFFHSSAKMCSKSSAADFVYGWKGVKINKLFCTLRSSKQNYGMSL